MPASQFVQDLKLNPTFAFVYKFFCPLKLFEFETYLKFQAELPTPRTKGANNFASLF